MSIKDKILCLFDVDGTLTKPRQVIDSDMLKFLINVVKAKCAVGLVGGSDLVKIKEQMGGDSFMLSDFDYIFPENGMIAIKNGERISEQSIVKYMGEEKLQRLINYSLNYMSQLTLPFKRGTFVEFRTGMINLSPVGRSCSVKERNLFSKYDANHKIREEFVKSLERDLSELELQYSIGGQISIDVFPKGWNKTFCLQFIEKDFAGKIHFFGDKTKSGENDYEIFIDPRVIGHSVTSPNDTKLLLESILNLNNT